MPRKYWTNVKDAQSAARDLAGAGVDAGIVIDSFTFEDPSDHWTYEVVGIVSELAKVGRTPDEVRALPEDLWFIRIRDEEGNRAGDWGDSMLDGLRVTEEETPE